MFISQKLSCVATLLTALLLSIISPYSAVSQESQNSDVLSGRIIQLEESKEKIDLTTDQHNSPLSIPRIDKLIVNQPYDKNNPSLVASLDKSLLKRLQLEEKAIEYREIFELSRELGIPIKNTRYIDLYREVVYWLGVPYKYGAMNQKAVDCSGFTGLVYQAVYNYKLPRVSSEISRIYKKTIKKEELEPGDLVFFATRGRKRINHVGIYLGDDHFIHASLSQGVIVSSLNDPYYARSWRRSARVEDIHKNNNEELN